MNRFNPEFTALLWKRIAHLQRHADFESRRAFSVDTAHWVITPFKSGICTRVCIQTDMRIVTADTLPSLLSTLRRKAMEPDK